jgi:hypothetical protein
MMRHSFLACSRVGRAPLPPLPWFLSSSKRCMALRERAREGGSVSFDSHKDAGDGDAPLIPLSGRAHVPTLGRLEVGLRANTLLGVV